ncbi:MAG: ABC transporter permease [Myxococcaceae bacterium]
MKFFSEQLAYLGQISRLSGQFFTEFFKYKLDWHELKIQCQQIGLYSMPLAGFTLLFVGFVFAYQFGISMTTLGATPYIGKLVSLSVIRELGPAFTALVVGGRVGAGMAAELGSMRVTEQIDAILALGSSPYQKLLVPRVLAATLMLPIVSLIASFIAILGGMLIAWSEFKVSPLSFYESSLKTVSFNDFWSGFFKPFFFGFGTAIIGCHHGFKCETGTAGVGKATTQAVVHISLMIVFVDFLLTRLFNQVWPH